MDDRSHRFSNKEIGLDDFNDIDPYVRIAKQMRREQTNRVKDESTKTEQKTTTLREVIQ